MSAQHQSTLYLYTDGLCEPVNPGGYTCWGWVAYGADGRRVADDYGCLGHGSGMSNNVAEYEAVIRALTWAKAQNFVGLVLRTDSQLVANQVLGRWSVKAPHLRPVVEKSRTLLADVGGTVEWVRREENEEADALSRKGYAAAVAEQPKVQNATVAAWLAEWPAVRAILEEMLEELESFDSDVDGRVERTALEEADGVVQYLSTVVEGLEARST